MRAETLTPDPRFGMLSPVVSSTTTLPTSNKPRPTDALGAVCSGTSRRPRRHPPTPRQAAVFVIVRRARARARAPAPRASLQRADPAHLANGAIVQKIDYDVWGKATLLAGSWDLHPFGFAGGLYDPDTGLVRFGARDYDPEVGRWTAKDPIRFRGGDTNIYAYAGNDPVNVTDQSGLMTYLCRRLIGEAPGSYSCGTWFEQWILHHQYLCVDDECHGWKGGGLDWYDSSACEPYGRDDASNQLCMDECVRAQLGEPDPSDAYYWPPFYDCQNYATNILFECESRCAF